MTSLAVLGAYFRNETGETSGTRAITYIVPIAIFGGLAGHCRHTQPFTVRDS
jgi:hypothetical protein